MKTEPKVSVPVGVRRIFLPPDGNPLIKSIFHAFISTGGARPPEAPSPRYPREIIKPEGDREYKEENGRKIWEMRVKADGIQVKDLDEGGFIKYRLIMLPTMMEHISFLHGKDFSDDYLSFFERQERVEERGRTLIFNYLDSGFHRPIRIEKPLPWRVVCTVYRLKSPLSFVNQIAGDMIVMGKDSIGGSKRF